jgi:hypothetical protein
VRRNTPTPVLRIAVAADGSGLSWIVPSANFVLQQAATLGADGWNDVTNAPTLNVSNLNNQLLLLQDASRAFYRLKMQ